MKSQNHMHNVSSLLKQLSYKGSAQESLVIISASISQYNNNSGLTQQKLKFQRLRPRADWSSGTS